MTSERIERRLAAVLAADVAGYSRLMGRDEEGTLAQLKSLRKTLLDPTIAAHRGRIVKTTGDGLLVEFASVVDAARCAVEVQRGMATQNADVPQDTRIEFRIGIHVGDIIIDDNDIFGDGVNIAARLEGIAEPGGVRKSGNRVRITGQLIDAATGAHIWADRFDGLLEDVFDLQDKVAESVVGAIPLSLQQAEIERVRRKPTGSLTAYDFYLRSLAIAHEPDKDVHAEASRLWARSCAYLHQDRYADSILYAERAIQRQPRWLPAFRYLAAALALSGQIEQARKVVARLLEISPSGPMSRAVNLQPLRRPEDAARMIEGLRLAGLPA